MEMAIVKISRFQRIVTLYRLMRTFTTSPRSNSNHYDVLGITPKATQGDIKSAYYNLSKVYHPDKCSTEDSAKKFRAIREAYEVLGNIKLKKMYDKGLLVGRENTARMDYQPDRDPTDPTLRFYKSHAQRHVTPTYEGRTPVYDFDAWSKHHYGAVFKRQQYEKEFSRIKREKYAERLKSSNQEAMIYMLVAVSFLFLVLTTGLRDDYDRDLLGQKRAIEKANESAAENSAMETSKQNVASPSS